jgi:hypothetical protein
MLHMLDRVMQKDDGMMIVIAVTHEASVGYISSSYGLVASCQWVNVKPVISDMLAVYNKMDTVMCLMVFRIVFISISTQSGALLVAP